MNTAIQKELWDDTFPSKRRVPEAGDSAGKLDFMAVQQKILIFIPMKQQLEIDVSTLTTFSKRELFIYAKKNGWTVNSKSMHEFNDVLKGNSIDKLELVDEHTLREHGKEIPDKADMIVSGLHFELNKLYLLE